jgi:hypothetical protein
MQNVYNCSLYFFLCVSISCIGVLVLEHSMNELFTIVIQKDLIWQLILPSAFFTLTLVVIIFGVYVKFNLNKIVLGLTMLILILNLMVFTEALYGYLWDLSTHAGVM